VRGERGESKRDTIGNFMEMVKDVCSKYLVSAFILTQAPKQENPFGVLGMGDEKEAGSISELARWCASTNMRKDSHDLLWSIYKGEELRTCNIEIIGGTGKIKNVERV
jgi:hypothetical protein